MCQVFLISLIEPFQCIEYILQVMAGIKSVFAKNIQLDIQYLIMKLKLASGFKVPSCFGYLTSTFSSCKWCAEGVEEKLHFTALLF